MKICMESARPSFRAVTAVARACGLALIAQAGAVIVDTPAALAQAQSPPPPVPALTVRFEGGDVPANAARVLDSLRRVQLVPVESAQVSKGQSVCDVYLDRTSFPLGCSRDLVRLADALNHAKYRGRPLQIGEVIRYPDVSFTQFTFSKRYDPKVPEDQKSLEDLKQHWSEYVISSETLSTRVRKVTLAGYELRVPMSSPTDARRATRALTAARIPNITFTHPEEQKNMPRYSAPVSPSKYMRDCQAGTLLPGEECAYSQLVGLDKLDWTPCGRKCPDVFLLDRPVRRNPALVDTVKDGWGEDDDPGPTAISPCTLPELKNGDHGTHLAGIIGAKGPTCVGLHPGARIHSWNRESDAARTSGDIESAQDRHDRNGDTVGLPIFVFASAWGMQGKNGQAGQRLTAPEDRFKNPIATQIRSHGALWIVAAGQPDPDPSKGERAVEITDDLALGPMNLGDERNVLVVTACIDCIGSQPALRDSVNYSTTMVHVAAPGDDMPGFAGVRRLAIGGGTSQAAAFAAGVASAMVSRYPNTYDRPELVKSRLQYSSRPVLSARDQRRVATGVIDPAVALLDPSKDYLQKLTGDFSEIALDGWCVKSFTVTDPETGLPLRDSEIRTRDILRMYRINRDDLGAPPRWIIYTKIPWDPKPGAVRRVGPAAIAVPGGSAGKAAPLLKPTGESPLSPGKFEDLLVRPSIGEASCSD